MEEAKAIIQPEFILCCWPPVLLPGNNGQQKRNWIRYVVTIFIIGSTYMILPMLLPIWKPEKLAAFYKKYGIEQKWEDQKNHDLPQDFADMLGWKELTKKTETFFNSLPDSTKDNTIIFTRHYGQAGSLKFYGNE